MQTLQALSESCLNFGLWSENKNRNTKIRGRRTLSRGPWALSLGPRAGDGVAKMLLCGSRAFTQVSQRQSPAGFCVVTSRDFPVRIKMIGTHVSNHVILREGVPHKAQISSIHQTPDFDAALWHPFVHFVGFMPVLYI